MSAWWVKIVNDLKEGKEKWKIPALMQALPKRLQSLPITTFLNANYLPPKKWGDKSIVFFCGNTAEPWTPKNLNEGGIGGSETAVIFLARLLAQKGWEVTVFNWCGNDAGVYDGVTYRNNWEYSPNDEYNIVIFWRVVELLGNQIKAKKIYLDLHDVPDVNEFTEERWKKVTKIFVKSKYHRSLLPKLPDEKFAIIPNGIDVSRYVGDFDRIPHSVIYSSSPNRGLDTLLTMWPKVREQYPDATLRVFYGWNTFFALEKGNPASLIWMNTIKDKMDSLADQGVINMGRVSQKELAEWQMKSTVWAYPTMFPEISCITAMEVQAAGCIPVCTDYAALSETVQYGDKIPSPISRPKNKELFLERLLERIDGFGQDAMMPVWAKDTYNWETIATQWNQELA